MNARGLLALILLAGLAALLSVILFTMRSPVDPSPPSPAGPRPAAAEPGAPPPAPHPGPASPDAHRTPAGVRGIALHGRVTLRRTGDPVAGHPVHLIGSDLKAGRDTKTDAQGLYAFDSVPPGEWFLVCDTTDRFPPDRNPAARRRITVPPDGDAILEDFPLVEGEVTAIAGTVLAADGTVLPHVRLDLYLTGKILARTLTVPLDDRGGFFLPVEKAASHYRLQAVAQGFLPATTPNTILVREGRVTSDVALVLVRPCRIEGRVVDPAGGPVPGASVFFLSEDPERPGIRRSRNHPAGDDGTFLAEDVSPGAVTVRAYHKGYHRPPPLELSLRQGETLRDVVLTLEPSAFVAGRVVDREGRGIAGGVVRAFGVTGATDAAGTFRVFDDAGDHAGEGTVEVYTWAPGYVARTWPGVPVNQEGGVFSLIRGGTIQGIVTLDAPPQGLVVRLRAVAAAGGSGEGEPQEQTRRFRGDRAEIPYRFPDLAPGTYRVEVSAEGYVPDALSGLVVREGTQMGHADLILRRDASPDTGPPR